MKKRFYTTHEAGEICGVFPTTVINWIRDGRLKANQTPGGHRRIAQPELLRFMKELDYPIPPELAGLGRRRILIVDDDPTVCRMIERAFNRFAGHFQVMTFSSGIEALVEIGKNPPDLIVLDVVMPVFDGAQVCVSLKENPATRDVKVIGISGKRVSGKKLAYIMGNTDSFFRKPLDIQELIFRAASLLRISI